MSETYNLKCQVHVNFTKWCDDCNAELKQLIYQAIDENPKLFEELS